MVNDHSFHIASVSRLDLDEEGYDTSDVNDETMQKVADGMAESFNENDYSTTMQIMADYLKIPKKPENPLTTFVCGECEHKEYWDADTMAEKGTPVCPDDDEDMVKVKDCGNCGREATQSIGEDMNRCDRCADL